MKQYIYLVVLILACLWIKSCERDDLCSESTPTTPNLIIDVFNIDSQENKKNVQNLVVADIDLETTLPNYTLVSSNNIVLPLKTTENSTQFILIKGASINDNDTPEDSTDDFFEGNYDTLTINYSRKDVYVSRACGYKTIFENVTLTIEEDDDNWILSQQPLNPNQSVEDETAAHFNIFH